MNGVYYISGELFWPKILGKPVPNYDRDGFEWTFEIKPDKEGVATLTKLGVANRINKGENGDRIQFRQREKRADGSPNRAIEVYDDKKRPWDQTTLIGNGSQADVKFKFVDNGKGRKASLYPQGVMVTNHEVYERPPAPPAFGPPEGGDDFHKDFDLERNDEMPL